MLHSMEFKLMSLVWEHSPVTASHLCRLAEDAIGWKRTTTYTVIARLAERGCLERRGSLVTPLLTREMAEDEALQSILSTHFAGDRARLERAFLRLSLTEGEEMLDKPFDM